MSKVLVYTALIVVCVGIGVLIGGLGVHFSKPYSSKQSVSARKATCVPRANGGYNTNIDGLILLSQVEGIPLELDVNITGLPMMKMGFHIHTYGVIDYDCTSAGGHFNPYSEKHGGPLSTERHVGDLGNIDGGELPYRTIKITDSHANLFGENSILGRSIVIHERQDDLISQSSAGGRLACCTIQRNQKEESLF